MEKYRNRLRGVEEIAMERLTGSLRQIRSGLVRIPPLSLILFSAVACNPQLSLTLALAHIIKALRTELH